MAKKKSSPGGSPRPRKRKKGGMRTIIFAFVVTVAAGIILLSYYGDRLPSTLRPFSHPAPTAPAATPQRPQALFKEISLYFSEEDGMYLKTERRRIKTADTETEAKEVLRELLGGPHDPRLASAIPEGTRLKRFFIKKTTAYVDLSKDVMEKHQGGSEGELQTIYSIVNTITLNFPEIQDVQILIEGKTESTLAGHIDISYPLAVDRNMIKG